MPALGRCPVDELTTRDQLERALTLCRAQWQDAKNMNLWDMRHWSDKTANAFRQMVLDLEARGKAIRKKLDELEKN